MGGFVIATILEGAVLLIASYYMNKDAQKRYKLDTLKTYGNGIAYFSKSYWAGAAGILFIAGCIIFCLGILLAAFRGLWGFFFG